MERIDYGESGKGEKRESSEERKRNNVDRKVGIKVWALVGKGHTQDTRTL